MGCRGSKFQLAQSLTGLAAFSPAIDFLSGGVDGTIQAPRRGHGHGYVNLERAEPDYSFLVVVSEAPIMTGDIPWRRAFVDTGFLGTTPLPHGPMVEMRECVAHVLDIGQGLQVPVTRSGKDVADDGVDPKVEQRLLFQPFCGQQLDQGEDEVACIDLRGADWGRARIRWVVEPGDRQSDGAAPPRRFGDRNRVGVVSRGPLNAGRKIGHGTVVHREDMRVCILPAPCEPRIVGGGCDAAFVELGGVMEWTVRLARDGIHAGRFAPRARLVPAAGRVCVYRRYGGGNLPAVTGSADERMRPTAQGASTPLQSLVAVTRHS